MKKNLSVVFLTVLVLCCAVISVCAQADPSLPAFRIATVNPDESVVFITKNLPAGVIYTVSMADSENPSQYYKTARFTSNANGSLSVTVKIPSALKGLSGIDILLSGEDGSRIPGNFINIERPAEPEPVSNAAEEAAEPEQEAAEEPEQEAAEETAEEPEQEAAEEAAEEPEQEPAEEAAAEPEQEAAEEAAEEPEQEAAEEAAEEPEQEAAPKITCDYSVLPSFLIDSVKRDESFTVTTKDFPPESVFSVQVGIYPPVLAADRNGSQTVPAGTDETDGVVPAVPESTSEADWIMVGSIESADGAPQTLTFSIPETFKGKDPLYVWVEDSGPCSFYAYNYFYNRD